MSDASAFHALLEAAVTGAGSAAQAAEQVCAACVEGLGVDGASLVVAHEGTLPETVGTSGELVQHLDDLQFTFGQGPSAEAVRTRAPVLVPDFDDPAEQRWPGLAGEVLAVGVHAVFALPVRITATATSTATLDLVRRRRGPLTAAQLDGALAAAGVAAVPLALLASAEGESAAADGEGSWEQLASLERVEVYQATGMVVAALGVGPEEALLRLRGQAIARGMTASELAWEVVERRLLPTSHEWRRTPRRGSGRPSCSS